MIFQKSSFLAGEAGIQLSVFFNKKFTSGLFGGEGFIMQKLSGQGIAFAEFDGHVVEYDLAPGQQIVVDTGYLAAMEATCSMEVKSVSRCEKYAVWRGGDLQYPDHSPGRIWLQTMPLSNVAGVLRPYMPTGN